MNPSVRWHMAKVDGKRRSNFLLRQFRTIIESIFSLWIIFLVRFFSTRFVLKNYNVFKKVPHETLSEDVLSDKKSY